MQSPPIARARKLQGRFTSAYSATIAVIALLCVLVVGHDLYRTMQDRSARIDESRRQVVSLVRSVDQHAEDAFRLTNVTLDGLVDRLENNGTGQEHLTRLRMRMLQLVATEPILDNLDVVDESGTAIADSRVMPPGNNVSDLEFFQYHQSHADRKPYVNPVVHSKISGKWVVVVSRRFNHADGSFAGVVIATINVVFFQNFYAALDLGRDGSAGLFRADGTVLVRQPFVEAIVGTKLPSLQPFNDPLSTASSGTFVMTSPVDGLVRLYAWQRVDGAPLVVAAALSQAEQLAGWRVGAAEHLLAAVIVAVLFAVIGVRLVCQVRLLSEAEQTAAAATAKAEAAAADYRLLADHVSDMIVLVDMDLRRRYVSPSSRDMLGYEPQELMGETPLSLAHPEDVERYTACIQGLAAGRDRDRLVYRARHRDGHWIWMDTSLTLIRDPETGEPQAVCGAGRDITEQVEAVAAMRESEERLRLVLQSNALAEAIYLLDPDGVIESWNAGAIRIMGYLPEEIIGKNFEVFFAAEDIASGEPGRVLAVAAKRGTNAFEAWRIRRDGSRFLAEIVVDALRNPDGTLRGFVKVTRDLTDRRVEEEQRRLIVEAAPNGILIVDEAGIITLANSQVEKIFDYPAGALAGQKLELLVQESLRIPHIDLRSEFTSGDSEQAMLPLRQITGRKSNGDPVPIEIMLSAVKTPRGRIVVAALFDVTERLRQEAAREAAEQRERQATAAANASLERLARHLARARDRAEQASRAKSRFLAGMSHELRTPLNGILGYAHLLDAEGDLSPTQTARVEAMKEAGKHLLEMITCVLDLSEIEADHLTLRPVEIDLPSIANACLDLIRPMAEAKGLGLGITIAPAMPTKLTADPTRLRQILLNLLGNAAKFTAKGSVALRMRPIVNGTTLRIEVADTGPGVPADQRDRLFQEFERLDAKVNLTVEGAGLGLVLSSRLAHLMGGSLGYDDNPGGGSVFWLELPLQKSAPQSGETAEVDAPSFASIQPVRIYNVLVVDDVLMNRDIASSFLRLGGHTATCVESGADAVAAAGQNDFDVILMDVRMPGMDGLEATRRIRALGPGRGDVPIVALTAQAFTDQIAACRAAGMDSHLAKPFDPDTLLAAVTQAVTTGHKAVEVKKATVADDAVAETHFDALAYAGDTLNKATFDRTTSFLPPETAAGYLRTIHELADSLLRRLRMPGAIARDGDDLADTVHSLCGSAAMFGFDRLNGVGRRFEHAIRSGSPDVTPLAEGLIAALEATLAEIHTMRSADAVH